MSKLRAIARRPSTLCRGEAQDAWALFARSPVLRLASTTAQGAPLLRTLHAVVIDGALCFHGGPVGEKVGCVGRAAVMAVEEPVVTLPSYLFDRERACPATTYYESAMAWGTVEAITSPADKATVLAALMQHLQPEGGHAPIDAADPRYASALDKLLVAKLVPERLEARSKLGQHKPRAVMEGVLEGLWRRGEPGDLVALERIRAAHPEPLTPTFLHHGDVRFEVAPRDVASAVALVCDEYWNEGTTAETLGRAHAESECWVMGFDERGAVATARATSDAKRGWIYDVAVRGDARGRGIGQALVRLLLDHPRLRETRRCLLGTRDAQGVYERLGFEVHAPRFTQMARSTPEP